MRMVDLSYESEHFSSEDDLTSRHFRKVLDHYTDGIETFLPVFEAKMTQQYDHRAADVVISATAQVRSAQPESLSLEDHQNPSRFPQPRFWMPSELAFRAVPEWYSKNYLLTYTLVTSPTNQRTMLAAIAPKRPAGHSLRLIYPRTDDRKDEPFLLAALNSFACDYICRNKIGGVNLNPVIAYQLPVPLPRPTFNGHDGLNEPLTSWIAKRVLELTYTAWDLEAFAQDCGWPGPPFRWDEDRRFLLRCELDAAFFHLYLGSDDEWRQQPEALTRAFPTPRHAVSYIMDTFPIVKRKDEAKHGTYRTKETILQIYDALAESIRTGVAYQTMLHPQPATLAVAHPWSWRDLPMELPEEHRVPLLQPYQYVAG